MNLLKKSWDSNNNLRASSCAMGNRIAKHIYSATGVWEKSTFYVRDASGNVMATYEETIELVNIDLDPELEEVIDYDCIERPIYGSSRLGMETTIVEMMDSYSLLTSAAQRTLGYKQYELSNHLGNVLAVVNDMKLPDFNGTLIVSYTSVMVSATDYSPFGVGLYGRSWSSEVYRYGFNGKEKEFSDGSDLSFLDYGLRMYNCLLGRFVSMDPMSNLFVFYSTYQYAANSPISCSDLDGSEPELEINKWALYTTSYGSIGGEKSQFVVDGYWVMEACIEHEGV